jgi:predicted ArsR family transcriptional regulator
MIQRHPCSIEDFTIGLGLSEDDARRHIQRLLEQGAIHAEVQNGVTFYVPQTNEHDG